MRLRRGLIAFCLTGLIAAGMCVSCSRRARQEDLPGAYVAIGRSGSQHLVLREDGTYTHTFVDSSGKTVAVCDGEWSYVDAEGLLELEDSLGLDYGVGWSSQDQPDLSWKGRCLCHPRVRAGRTYISLGPDTDIALIKEPDKGDAESRAASSDLIVTAGSGTAQPEELRGDQILRAALAREHLLGERGRLRFKLASDWPEGVLFSAWPLTDAAVEKLEGEVKLPVLLDFCWLGSRNWKIAMLSPEGTDVIREMAYDGTQIDTGNAMVWDGRFLTEYANFPESVQFEALKWPWTVAACYHLFPLTDGNWPNSDLWLRMFEVVVSDGEESDCGPAARIEYYSPSRESGYLCQVVEVDVRRGCVPLRMVKYGQDASHEAVFAFSDFLEATPGLWIPLMCDITIGGGDTGKLHLASEIARDSVDLEFVPAPGMFEPHLSADTRIVKWVEKPRPPSTGRSGGVAGVRRAMRSVMKSLGW